MGKNKRTRLGGQSAKSAHKKLKTHAASASAPPPRPSSKNSAASNPHSGAKSPGSAKVEGRTKPHVQQLHLKPTVPFRPEERILLVGEGDLSFAASLVGRLGCREVTATVLEKSEQELKEKYESVAANLAVIAGEEIDGGEPGGEDVEAETEAEGKVQGEAEGNDDEEGDGHDDAENTRKGKGKGTVIFGVDATKMVWPGKKKPMRWDRIIFNFPHVGGKSTDVNRQVRYNQELLVSFFRAATPLLSPLPSYSSVAPPSIIVTLFEGSPYTLWNIRDLARHSGLAVSSSFAFQASAYPGYSHARTIGTIRKRDAEGKRAGEGGGGWKGEERKSRSYVFVRKEDLEVAVRVEKEERERKKKKRKRDGSEEDDDDEEEEDAVSD